MRVVSKEENLRKYNQVLCVSLEIPGKEKVLEAIEELEKNPDVLYVGPDYKLSLCASPYDEYYNGGQQWAISKINLQSAWDITKGSTSVKVGIIDTGIDGDHPDLIGKIDTGLCRDFTTGSTIPVGTPTDNVGHGTACAGVIGANTNNGEGIAGVCWDVKLVSLRCFTSSEIGYSSHVGAAIDFAETVGIPILNLSGGWYETNTSKYNYPLYTVISMYSGLIVCSAGNDNLNIDSTGNRYYPASYDLANVIAVGASNEGDRRISPIYGDETQTNYGPTNVDLFAPGGRIVTTYNDGGYVRAGGTSLAAPYVTGVAALVLSKYPNLSATQIKQRILNNVDSVPGFASYCLTGGRLNAYGALAN